MAFDDTTSPWGRTLVWYSIPLYGESTGGFGCVCFCVEPSSHIRDNSASKHIGLLKCSSSEDPVLESHRIYGDRSGIFRKKSISIKYSEVSTSLTLLNLLYLLHPERRRLLFKCHQYRVHSLI